MNQGLKPNEVQARVADGKVNANPNSTIKTRKQIIIGNIFTLFNGINLFLALLVFITGQYRNALFMLVIIINTVIGIIQELKAKKTLDKLRMLSQPHALVIRDGQTTKISGEELVIDDLCKLKLGDQILSDGQIIDGSISVNEALLTGESDNIEKTIGNQVLAGSFVTSGNCIIKITSVGKDNYINHILKNAKREKRQPSRLRDALDFIIKTVSIIIVPLGIIIFLKQYFLSHIGFNETILQTVASLVGMIPEGLILLTSVALTLGALKLSSEKTLVQELYSLETLARCNVLCLDKTGTITTGKLNVLETINYSDNNDIANIIANITYKSGDENPTALALKAAFPVKETMNHEKIESFSSQSKKTVMVSDGCRYELGAYEFIDKIPDYKAEADIAKNATIGNRVLALSKDRKVIGLVIIQDEIRSSAKETLSYFAKQGVDLKVISGDDPKTVANILKKVAFKQADLYVDCSKLTDEQLKVEVLRNNIFGRVSPDQKRIMIEALKQSGKTVGMVGDGVNDVMALKEADFSVAMFDGAESARNIANVVLLDNDFSHMHKIVDEGRRVINNIQRTATLFLSKTVLSILLAILTIFFFKEYPFSPIQLTLISSLCIGMPSFFLSLEPRHEIVKGNFLANVLSKALPAGLSLTIVTIILELLARFNYLDQNVIQTMAVLISGITLSYILFDISRPLNILRTSLIIIAIGGIALAYMMFKSFFYFATLNFGELIVVLVLAIFAIALVIAFDKLKIAKQLSAKIDDLY